MHKYKVWIVGDNMPGYMPDSDPYYATDAEHARDCLIETLTRDLEYCEDSQIKEIQEAISEIKSSPLGSMSGIVAGRSYWITPDILTAGELEKADCDPQEYEKWS